MQINLDIYEKHPLPLSHVEQTETTNWRHIDLFFYILTGSFPSKSQAIYEYPKKVLHPKCDKHSLEKTRPPKKCLWVGLGSHCIYCK